MREIKFRVWHPKTKIMSVEFTLMDAMEHEVDKTSNDEIYLQFTGLLDKQGVEIYEGDIVHIMCGDTYFDEGIVTFGEFSADIYTVIGYYVANKNNTQVSEAGIDSQYEVIGNIYENAELLK